MLDTTVEDVKRKLLADNFRKLNGTPLHQCTASAPWITSEIRGDRTV
jgi:hypothetical protein